MKTRTKLFWILLILAIISVLLIIPYIITVQSEAFKAANLPLPVVVLVAAVQGAITLGIATILGLLLAEKTGFQLPLLTSWLEHKKIEYKGTLILSIILGLVVGIIIFLLDRFVFQHAVEITVPLWQGFLACFYGGIAEEILMRLFLMSLFVFVLMWIFRKTATPGIVWTSIILVSILFGLGHLPITAAVVDITPMIVFRAILLNGIGGVVFGWLYWKKGLESAIIAHFFADIILHVMVPALL